MRKSREGNYKFGNEEGHREGEDGSGWRYEFGFATNEQYNALHQTFEAFEEGMGRNGRKLVYFACHIFGVKKMKGY